MNLKNELIQASANGGTENIERLNTSTMGHRLGFLKLRIFAALRKRVLGKYAYGVIYNTANGLLAAPIDDVSLGKSLGFKGAYDTPEISTLQDLLTKDDVVYVIGTHIGALLPWLKRAKK